MKVLLLQEMSGVHTELKKGLNSIGVEAYIATHGDGFKSYSTDIDLGSISGKIVSHLDRIKKQSLLALKFSEYDIIQTISPQPFYKPLNAILNAALSLSDNKKVYLAAGSDAIYRNHVRELVYYPPHAWFENPKDYNKLKKRLINFNTIIPVCWEYEYSMNRAGLSPLPVVPFPIDLELFKPKIMNHRKLKFFHPLNRTDLRYDFKGTLIIQEAFRILSKKYSDVAEFICRGDMTHQQYDTFTDDVDVIVDQLYSYSYGMSAALGLAKGKVVISGLEKKAKVDHFEDCPIINCKPEVDDLIIKIETLINNRHAINDIKMESRYFAEEYHCSKKVANKFLKIYMEN